MKTYELALLCTGALMVCAVFSWIGYCLAKCWYGRRDKND